MLTCGGKGGGGENDSYIIHTEKICGKNVNQDLTYQYTAGGTLL